MNDIEYQENSSYSIYAYDAVRYCFQFRKAAEELAKSENESLHFNLIEPSDVLIFLAEAILSGVTYDILKSIVTKTWSRIKEKFNANKEDDICKVFLNEDCLLEFYTYIIEFNNRRMSITEQQEEYIKEEVVADYCGKKFSEVLDINGINDVTDNSAFSKRMTIIYKEGYKKADRIIVRKK